MGHALFIWLLADVITLPGHKVRLRWLLLISPCRDDDDLRTQLRAHITALMPAELILPRGRLSAVTHKLLRASLRSPRINELVPGKGGFWDAEQAFEEICAARCSRSSWPPLLHMSDAEHAIQYLYAGRLFW